MKNNIVSTFIFIFCFVIWGCNKSIGIREMDFYDYVYSKDMNDAFGYKVLEHNIKSTRIKGFLLKNIPRDLSVLEEFLLKYTRELLSVDFVAQSEKMILESQDVVDNKYIEIDFFRTSKEFPWVTDDKFIPPYHIGEGNPKDWVGSVLFNINKNEIDYYWFVKRKKGIVDYGKILEKIELLDNKVRVETVMGKVF